MPRCSIARRPHLSYTQPMSMQYDPVEIEFARPARAFSPIITYLLLGLCILVYLAVAVTGGNFFAGLASPSDQALRSWGMLTGYDVARGEWWRLLTYGLLHGGLTHIFFNGMALLIFGRMIEQWQGHVRFLAIIAFSVLTGGLLAIAIAPASAMVGISGGIFGLMGAMMAIMLRFKSYFAPSMLKGLKRWLLQLLGINLVISLLPGISFTGHLGGLIGGFIITYIIARPPTYHTGMRWQQWVATAVLLLGTGMAGLLVIDHVVRTLTAI